MTPWTNQTMKLLEDLVRAGTRPCDIMKRPEFSGRTRNSIIGMCYRVKLKLGHKPLTSRERIDKRKAVKIPEKKMQLQPKEDPRVSLLTAKLNQCRYPVGGTSDDGTMLVCGSYTAKADGPYCHTHERICYQRK